MKQVMVQVMGQVMVKGGLVLVPVSAQVSYKVKDRVWIKLLHILRSKL